MASDRASCRVSSDKRVLLWGALITVLASLTLTLLAVIAIVVSGSRSEYDLRYFPLLLAIPLVIYGLEVLDGGGEPVERSMKWKTGSWL